VTALEIGDGLRMCASVTCRWKAPRIVVTDLDLHGGVLFRSLGGPKKPRSCESAATVNGEATRVSEARFARKCAEEGRRAPTRTARQSELGVVKRLIPQSRGSACKCMAQGRSESFGEMLGTDKARVLVVEALWEAKKSVSTHRGCASRRVARQAVEG